ncbi:tyrosine-type recombinase/integrase [Nitrosomonas communis]|uniref:Integrase n=1 Tax=Nitrosomonas communis TaxID=44574 RepID=A0A1I4QSS4_9PROT|nr:integrase arm-type DNA-binding domain-containing protein [Nitrosomonas communis]SFM42763.1 Integrase [Nitrosomonas communis]
MSLTDAEIRNTKSNSKVQYLFDNEGLYLQVNPNGSRWWRFKYRFQGKPKLLSLGIYPNITLKDARLAHFEARKLITKGIDPSAQRKQAKADIKEKSEIARRIAAGIPLENSFQAVALEWFDKQTHTWVPHHAKDVKRRLENNIFPYIGTKVIAEIEPPELLAAIRKIEERGSYDLAHRVLQLCGQIFRYGVATGYCKRDPSPDLRGALTPHKKMNQAAIQPEELPDLLRAIASYDDTGNMQTRLALQLLALAFVRTSELIGAVWAEFDFDKAIWLIPAERMKMRTPHVVPLSSQAITILKELKVIAGDSSYILPGRNPRKPVSNNTMLFALYRLGYKSKMTGHGFRAVASTILNEAGFRSDVIELQLAHCERNEVRGAYNRAQYLEERKQMMQWWGNYLEKTAAGAEVIPLHGRAIHQAFNT